MTECGAVLRQTPAPVLRPAPVQVLQDSVKKRMLSPEVVGSSEGEGRGSSAGDLLQGAQICLEGDGHGVADGLGVVRHGVAGTLKVKGSFSCFKKN